MTKCTLQYKSSSRLIKRNHDHQCLYFSMRYVCKVRQSKTQICGSNKAQFYPCDALLCWNEQSHFRLIKVMLCYSCRRAYSCLLQMPSAIFFQIARQNKFVVDLYAVLLFISNYIGDRIIGSVSCIMQLLWLSDARFAVLLDKEGGFTTFVN